MTPCMSTADVAALLMSYCAVTALMLLTQAIRKPVRVSWLFAIQAVGLLAAAVAVASLALKGQNSVAYVFKALVRLERTNLAAVVLGVCLALLASMAFRPRRRRGGKPIAPIAVYAASVAVLVVLASKELVSSHFVTPDIVAGSHMLIERSVASGFRIEEIASLEIAPTSLAADSDRKLFVAGYMGVAFQNGAVASLERTSGTSTFYVTDVPSYLNRPHGLAVHDGELFISRSGQFTRAVAGRFVQENTGAITRAKDLDGDGKLDYFSDVVTNLPGAHQPDGLHQNNGIAFDADAYLYITVGAASDHGPSVHPHAGTILRARPDGSDLTVFARGFRNPFDLTFGPDGELFCTDNDPDSTNPGDALFHVVENAHYGFPYSELGPSVRVTGVTGPLLRSTSALEGITYVPSGRFPAGYDNCLYVASFADGHINRIQLTRDGATYRATMDVFARVPGALDVIFAPDGALYACSFSDRKVYRISPETR